MVPPAASGSLTYPHECSREKSQPSRLRRFASAEVGSRFDEYDVPGRLGRPRGDQATGTAGADHDHR